MTFRTYTDDDVINVLRLALAGKTAQEIVEGANVPYHQVAEWCKKAHVQYKRNHRQPYDWAKILRAVNLPVPNELENKA